MKSIQFFDTDKSLKIGETKKPEISEGEALIKIEYAGICGSDIERISSGKWNADKFPVIPGHELVGRVEEIKNGRKDLLGKRVAIEPTISCSNCNMCKAGLNHICYNRKLIGVHIDGGMAEYIKVQAKKIHLIPDSISIKNAVLLEPISVGLHLFNRSCFKLNENAVIAGAGIIGIVLGNILRISGARRISFLEKNPYRIDYCKKAGFEVLESGKLDDEANNFDAAFELSAGTDVANILFKLLRKRGRIVLAGFPLNNYPYDILNIIFKEIEIRGSLVYSTLEFENAIDLLLNSKLNLENLVTRIIKLQDYKNAFDLAADKKEMKVVLEID